MMRKIKILLVCAGGMSTGILMQKMEKYASENDIDLKIKATGVMSYDKYCQDFDVILVGPQVRYLFQSIQKKSQMPCAVMDSLAYGLQNCPIIMKQAFDLIENSNE